MKSLPRPFTRLPQVRTKKTLVVLAAGLVIVVGVVGASRSYQLHQNQEASRQSAAKAAQTAATLKAQALQKQEELQRQQELAAKTQQEATKSNTPQTTPPPASAPDKQPVKYATSSDPRSTAYSLTPPAPNPASFNIAITHAGQVAAGTVISYNATKGERSFYGGDLILSQSTVTLSKSTNPLPEFTVTIPDGQTSGAPSTPWNDTNRSVYPAYHASPADGTSWTMFVAQYAGDLAPGTYTVHLSTVRVGQAADQYEYDGFLTVNVIP